MASERYIDLQLIKPLVKGSGIKGKISLTNLFKEYFNKLNVGYSDSCCPSGSPGSFGCPTISTAVGNAITCNEDGLFASAGSSLAANNGLSVNSGDVVIGQNVGAVGDPAALLSNREIPMGAFTMSHKDSSGNSNLFGAGTLVSTRVSGGRCVQLGNTKTTNISTYGTHSTNTVNFTSFSNDTSLSLAHYGVKRYNTVSTGQTITTNTSVRQGVYMGTLQFENDVAANNNPITITTVPISVFHAKVDFWPGAGSQLKNITGAICGYSTFFDCGSLRAGCSLTSFMDFEAGNFAGTISGPIAITNRYGFKCLDLNAGSQTTTNRWAFYQEGTTDSNYFAGFSGFGVSAPSAKVHVAAGTATAGTAPIKLTAGVNLTTPENGAFEFDGTNLYFTVGGVRKTVTLV